MERINVKTNNRIELIDIADKVQAVVTKSKIKDGVCVIFCPHTTAGLTINENADPSVRQDIINAFEFKWKEGAVNRKAETEFTSTYENSQFHVVTQSRFDEFLAG